MATMNVNPLEHYISSLQAMLSEDSLNKSLFTGHHAAVLTQDKIQELPTPGAIIRVVSMTRHSQLQDISGIRIELDLYGTLNMGVVHRLYSNFARSGNNWLADISLGVGEYDENKGIRPYTLSWIVNLPNDYSLIPETGTGFDIKSVHTDVRVG